MTNNQLTDKRLAQLAKRNFCQTRGEEYVSFGDEVVSMAREAITLRELLKRAKQLMYQSGGAPIEGSLNPIDAFLFDAERAELQERREAMKPLAGIDLESAADRLMEKCEAYRGDWYIDNRNAYLNGFRDGAEAGLNAEKEGNKS